MGKLSFGCHGHLRLGRNSVVWRTVYTGYINHDAAGVGVALIGGEDGSWRWSVKKSSLTALRSSS